MRKFTNTNHSKAKNSPPPGGVGGGLQPRTYRRQFSSERFCSFTVNYKESDLWIGIDPESFHPEMEKLAFVTIKTLRHQLEHYFLVDPEFGRTLIPCASKPDAPEIVKILAEAGKRAGVGPMAAVAGAFSEKVGKTLLGEFLINELVVENGGDIFLKLEKPMFLSVFAGSSALSEKIGIEIPAQETPLGVCTSSGTVGPSLSFGKADAVMVACKNTAVADAFATAMANRIKGPGDVQTVAEASEQFPDILSLVAICQDKLGIRSKFEMKLVAPPRLS
ncbi:MAG: UPF0280 family protein [Prolixibacteraceae bacterium]|nr:UPF0280 family protein [Prolixibacteraceae bacterium]